VQNRVMIITKGATPATNHFGAFYKTQAWPACLWKVWNSAATCSNHYAFCSVCCWSKLPWKMLFSRKQRL